MATFLPDARCVPRHTVAKEPDLSCARQRENKSACQQDMQPFLFWQNKKSTTYPGVELINVTKGCSLAAFGKFGKLAADGGFSDVQDYRIKDGLGILKGWFVLVIVVVASAAAVVGWYQRCFYHVGVSAAASFFRTGAAPDSYVILWDGERELPQASLGIKLDTRHILLIECLDRVLDGIDDSLQFLGIIYTAPIVTIALQDTDPQEMGRCPVRTGQRCLVFQYHFLLRIQQRRCQTITTFL